ncbi:MAG: arsenic efflux protein [Clostridia bacterium]|nr:arsenic efflux protein [Clostridia bacterium]
MFNTILHVFLHSLKDYALTLPVLFICYLLIELLEDKILNKYQSSKALKKRWAPIVSAGFGLIPQCGFSVVATDLFSKKAITLGSLFAIFIATSDEALPLMLSNPANYGNLAIILGVKFVYAVIVGLIIDLIINLKHKKEISLAIAEGKTVKVERDKKIVLNDEHVEGCCKHKLEKEHSKVKELFVHPLVHSLKIFFFIVLFGTIFGCIVEFIGEDSISSFMSSTGFFEPFIVSLVGLIPNCASSVLITQVFLMGGISIGSCIAGLCINSGIAMIMLFKMNKNIKQNFLILGLLYVLSCFIGVIINLF